MSGFRPTRPAYQWGKPRVIRKVTEKDAKGRPKVAKDGRARIIMTRVTAKTTKPCSDSECTARGWLIRPGTEYAKVTLPMRATVGKYRGRRFPESKDYHIQCVPPEARPLVRFLWPKQPDG